MSPLRRWLTLAAILLVVSYGVGLGLLYANQRSLIYPAPDRPWPDASGFRTIGYRTSDGLLLRGLYRPANTGKPTIIFFHGNGDSLSGSLVSVESYAAAGYGLLLAEYRGYGGNPGATDELGLYADGRAARNWLVDQGIGSADQVLMGFSLGTGIAAELAVENTPAALVLVSPYTSLPDVVSYRFAGLIPAILVKDRIDTASRIAQVRSPILIMHDRDDRSIPVTQGQRLARLAEGSKLVLFSGHGHQLGFAAEAQQTGLEWLEGLN